MPMSGEPHGGAAPAQDPEEREVLRRFREVEREGLAWLMDRYGEALMRYLISILHDREAAEDLFQESWLQALRKARRSDPGRPFAPWFFRLARNLAYDELRRRRRRSFFGLEAVSRRKTASPGAPSPALERLSAEDLAGKLLSRLDPLHREMIHLRFYRECSYEEIAGICGVPVGTVKSRIRRALDRLGALREEMDHENESSAG
jgi:RNA polymerase sigma-70 factor, ECF subfamily